MTTLSTLQYRGSRKFEINRLGRSSPVEGKCFARDVGIGNKDRWPVD
jgi:hypothetical protein